MLFGMKFNLVLLFIAVAHSASVDFDEDGKVKDDSVFDRILAVNQKAASRSRNGGQSLYQGDIVVNDAVRDMMDNRKRGAQDNRDRLWPLVIPYEIEYSVRGISSILRKAMDEWKQKVPCLNFVKRTYQKDYISFFKGDGCYSSVGRVRGKQRISIGRGCEYHGTVLHEIGHALGFWHEQSRPDRDEYITINLDNVIPNMRYNFNKQTNVNSLGVPYDYDSIMHYGRYAFSRSPRRLVTIQTKGGQRIGHRQNLSEKDVKQANLLYKCSTGGGGTGGGTGGGSNCTDKNKNCENWSKKGLCTGKYHRFMTENCQKSCKFC